MLRRAGADALAVDRTLIDDATLDALGEAIDTGMSLWLGAIPTDSVNPSAARVADAVIALWNKLGFAPSLLADSIVVTPACGLAGSTPDAAQRILRELRETGARLRDHSLS